MGFKIWRKDKFGYELAFDVVFETEEKANEQIAELNARYFNNIKYNDLSFFSYKEDIKLSKDGSVIKPNLPRKRFKSKFFGKRNNSKYKLYDVVVL